MREERGSTRPERSRSVSGTRGTVLIDSPHRDDNLLGVRPPGPSSRDAVSTKSSKDKRPKRSLKETLTGRVVVSAPHRTNDVDAAKRRRTLGGVPDSYLTAGFIERSHERALGWCFC